MNFRHLKYFVATAETGQVRRAATALSISQSSVTGAIRELEAELGTALFQRSARGMEMTDAGREFLASAHEILEKLDEATKLTRRHSAVSGVITLATTYTVIGYFLPYHLDRLAQLHPGLEIRLHELNRESIEEGLLSNRFDIAVLLTSNLTNPDLESETLLRSTRRLWVANNHPFQRRGKASFAEIAREDYIMLTVDEAAHTAMKYWSMTGHQPRVKLRTSSVEAVRSMVANGQGITILSDMVYRPWSLEGKRIGTVPTDLDIPSMDIGLAWRRGLEFNRPLAIMHDYFRQAFASPQAPYSGLRSSGA
ncbi:DNA-binding transcriptional regulator, LysR family [Salinihabitans flavidus]|uniref:DNA-binding transcriptional regulator, LysR family n=1 Tax=Salinihabitans flavidus TaxID=569882 RepID=A0A1H8MMV6_9RHOB|nr:LysR family transcriptional regulator [Salinihabitans flavidus]SEO18761.1 DNA-binding transcriptional regulator, LysR family [Salinihabitans flavidus]